MRQILSVCGLCAMNAIFLIQNARVVMQLKERLSGQRHPLQMHSVLYTNSAVIDNNYNSYGQCSELPCKKFIDLKDPDISDEQHYKSIDKSFKVKG